MTPAQTTHTPLLPVALRNTALTVTGLGNDTVPVAFDTFRLKCRDQIELLRTELTAAGHPRDTVEDAAYAQCALLDEVALKKLKGADRDAWERLPLQVSEFQSLDAGEELIARIERRIAEPQPPLPLLAIFAAVLALGFQGKFALDGPDAPAALTRALNERLGRYGDNGDASSPILAAPRNRRRWFGHLSPLTSVIIAWVAAGVVYIALYQWLITSIAGIGHQH
jgi:type VI secretion system protein ImpK